ncbi:MAG: sigma-54-dependent Fis family transcriptional regulator [Gemmatimonadetes bacterium]|nr:sigma-54-dependent Fis family transcriptional regulator [Gemmatimonadota bacterium]
MAETVLITTQELEPAVRLRDAFRDAGYGVELITPGERVADVPDAALLVLTGALEERQARRLTREAMEQDGLPVIGLFDTDSAITPDAKQRFGLHEGIAKPADPAEVVLIGRRLIDRGRLRRVTGIVGETDPMVETLERVIQIAPVSSTVLLTGESGTGKERVARGIHALSPRRHKPFIATNVAAMAETLLESELFGHEKGAFTGAVGQRKGFFELAHRGTLFLDEMGEMPMATQTKLLRVLEEQRFRRLGGETEIAVDVRVIAATNQPLRQLVEVGRFRRDLYFRLNVLHIDLPPLRERRADIPLLVEAFIREASREHDRPRISISSEAMAILTGYDWPGNVRELRNLVESMVVLAPGQVIRPEDIPPDIRDARGRSRLLPVPLTRSNAGDEPSGTPPELEFIFHTLVQLRVDVEDLRHQFDEYRQSHAEVQSGFSGLTLPPPTASTRMHIVDIEPEPTAEDLAAEHDVVVFRPGMTLADLEKNAITAALREVAGNRRKAAEMLGMGERTLYRKIKEYGL